MPWKRKKEKFTEVWNNQTDLGKRFGISAIGVGKALIAVGLKDPKTKQATLKATQEGYAKFTPLKDGTRFFMWNIDKVCLVLMETHTMLSKVDYYVNEVTKSMSVFGTNPIKPCYSNDYFYMRLFKNACDRVPKDVREDVRKHIIELYEK